MSRTTISKQTVTQPSTGESADFIVSTDGVLYFVHVTGGVLSDGQEHETFCRVESALQRAAIEAGLYLSE